MPVDPRGLFDVYQDLIVQSLIEYRDEQVAIDPTVGFEITQDLSRFPEIEKDDTKYTKFVPLVCVFAPNTLPLNGAVNKQVDESCDYTIEMLVKSKGDEDEFSEQVATRRLRYLIQQTKNAIYRLSNSHFGKVIQELGKKSWPTVTIFSTNEDRQEEAVVGASLKFTITLPYYPPGKLNQDFAANNVAVSQLLEIISVNGNYFEAEYWLNGYEPEEEIP